MSKGIFGKCQKDEKVDHSKFNTINDKQNNLINYLLIRD
jgi:hypothetical protein